jgi:hypothetical protein
MRMKLLVFSILLMFVLSACNLPSVPGIDAQAATIIAMTLQAAATPQTGLGTPTVMSIVTQTGGPVKLTVTDNTNCRSGPGINYARLTTIPAGTTVIIVARYAAGSYWIVTPPDGSANCWVQGDLGTVSGDTTILTEVTPVASADKGAPAKPASFYYNYECPFGNLTTVLSWSDSADNETGYRVYRYDQLIAELPANSTTFSDNTTLPAGTGINYGVEAFNEAGVSERRTISFTCQ